MYGDSIPLTLTTTRRHGVSETPYSSQEQDNIQTVASTTLYPAPKSWLEEQLNRLFSHAPEKASVVAEPSGTQDNNLSRIVLILYIIVAAFVIVKMASLKPKRILEKKVKVKVKVKVRMNK